MPGYTFCSGMVHAAGLKQTSTGQVTYTSGLISTGVYSITFAAAHPIGNTYITNITNKIDHALIKAPTYKPTSVGFNPLDPTYIYYTTNIGQVKKRSMVSYSFDIVV